jgi:hypothetical protein
MKKLIFIGLMFGFLIGNAQQDRQQFGPNTTKKSVQYYTENPPGYPVQVNLNRYTIRKTDDFNPGYPSEVYLNNDSNRKPDDFNPGYPSEVQLNKYSSRKTTSHPGYPIFTDTDRYRMKIAD